MAIGVDDASSANFVSCDEIKKHNKAGDCWIIIHGRAYDVSTFDHPGGSASKLERQVRNQTRGQC